MREIASIILFLAVALVSGIVYQQADAVEIDKEVMATEQLSRLNTLYKGIDAFCEAPAKAFHADLVIACKAKKSDIKNQFADRINFLIEKRLVDAEAKVRADALEADCLQKARSQAEASNVQYETSDNCAQVLSKIEAATMGSGSGSGGGGI